MPSPRKQAQNTIKAVSPTVKYKKYGTASDPSLGAKKSPSQLVDELTNAPKYIEGWRPKPSVVQLLNIAEYSHQVDTSVGLDEPLFQPFPPCVTFHNPEAYKAHEAVLYLRNNDKVARRVKVLQPDSPLLNVRRVKGSAVEDKIASGMEVAYSITYTPEDTEQFHYDLVICTEREKFLVPCTVAGSKAALDFPDRLQFPMTPAKCSASQTCLVTNVGAIDADFTLTAYPPFRVEPARAQLASGDTMQCSIHFTPQSTGSHTGDLEIQYEQGDLVYASLSGECSEVDVQLSQPALGLQPTYIDTRSQGTFSWRQFATAGEEFDCAAADMSDILKETSTRPMRPGQQGVLDSLSSEDEDSDVAELATANSKRRQLEGDQYLFSDTSFQVSPAQGSIWPGMEAEITVTFEPDHAREYKATAYCDVGGRSSRLPIQFCGTGLGPKAVFSYDLLDVGEAFINTPHKYEVELLNRGQIPAQFKLLPFDSPYASKFSFRPREGTLAVGEVKTIRVQLQSDLLGTFSDTFTWSLNGSSEALKLQFNGAIVGPKYKVDVDAVDFGLVAFGFRYAKEFTLTNTCAIPMQYAWRVPKDSLDPAHKEFTVSVVSFTREGLHNIPIKAECVVPMVTPSTDLLDFEQCYLRHPYKRVLTLSNGSKLPCKCEVLGQEARSQGLATFTTSPNAGVIPAKGTLDVEVTLQASRLGRIQLPLQIKVLGSRRGPLECIIGATAVGPTLHFGTDSSNLASKTEIAFGSIDVLQARENVLQVHNPTDILASLKTLVEGRDSPFQVAPREAQLQPHESMAIKVTVLLDEAKQHKDVLHLFVTEGDDITVPLSATGLGHVVTCPAIADGVDFGPQFTGHRFSKEVVIQNQGKHPVTLAWANSTFAGEKSKQAKAQKNAGKAKQEEVAVVEPVPVYSVIPDRITIAPKSSCQLEFFGFSAQPGQIQERFICTLGTGVKSKQTVFDIVARANIAPPVLQFSERRLDCNTSKVDAAFHWQFADSDTTDELPQSSASNQAKIAVGASAFDILPTRGMLKAGESRTVEFAYYARRGQKASTNAVCEVEGGPTYTLPVTADSNAIKYTVEPQVVDIGPVLFDRASEKEVSIYNRGRVQFTFDIDTSGLSRPSVCDVTPKTGTVMPGQHAVLKLKVVAGMPDNIQEVLRVKVAHFDPVTLTLVGQGVYPALLLTLPRVRNEDYDQALIEAQDSLRAAQLKPQPVPRSASPPPSRGGRASSSPPPKSPQSPRRTGRTELTPKLQLEAEADRLLMIKQISKQVRKFKAINTGSVGVTFAVDNKTLEKSGFTFSPDKVPTLTGAPTHAALELTVTLQTARLKMTRGLIELDVPLRMKAGPTVMLHMKGCLLTPDVQLSASTLAFGPVQTGKCKVMMVLMHNTREVPAEWQVKPPVDAAAAADWSYFKCQPEQGLLPPGQKQLLKVMFTPGGHSHAPKYKQGIPIKITHNNKGTVVMCTASSFMLKAAFDPPLLDLGAILPHFDGQQPNQALLKLINTADVDMEVFSLDWDKQYLEDEAALREAGGYDANDIQLLDPLPPGTALWPDLPPPPAPPADGPQPVPPEAEADGSAILGGLTGSKATAGGQVAAATTLSSWVSMMPDAQALADSMEDEEPPMPGGLNLVVMGPPLAGKSVQAQLLSERYQLVVTTVDDLLMEAAQLPDSKVDANFADELFAKVIGLPPSQQEEGYIAPHTQLQATELEALVKKALVAALTEEQYTRGIVIDGLTSQYLSPELAANLLLASMGLQKTLHAEALPPPPPPAPPKGKKAEPLPPAPPLDLTAFHWSGDKHVYFVELDMSPNAIKLRHREGAAQAAAEEASLLPPPSPPPELVTEADEALILAGEKVEQTRWVVPARSTQQLIVQFQSEDMGVFKETLVFEVAGCEGRSSITVSGVCDQPRISTDPKQVFPRRAKTRPDSAKIARHFIMSSGQFEFGPLLAGKDSKGYREGAHPEHCTKLHMTNCGKFDLHVEWELKSQPVPVTPPVPAGKGAKPKAASAAAKDAAALAAAAPVFLFEPKAMDLKVGETQDITIWAFPKNLESIQDMLLGRIASNPTPVEFPISCVGAKPHVEIRLDMPPPSTPAAAPADAVAAAPAVVAEPPKVVEAAKPAAAAKGTAKKSKEPPPPELPLTPRSKLVREGVVFERLLLGQTQRKVFIVHNTSLLPVKWRLAGAEALPQEFKLHPSSGEIPARQQIPVTVEFTAFQKRDLSEKVTLQTEDVAGIQGVAQEVGIALKGEAYCIDVAVKYPDPAAAILDYGLMKATQTASKSVSLVNTGKYAVAFAFHQRGAMMKELFTITPAEGNLAPGTQQAVELAFNRGQVLKREVTLADRTDITVAITEPLTGRKEVTLPVKISARAVFSKYSITPARALNFGPAMYNTSTGPRTLEVTNVGEVPVNLRLFDPAKGLEAAVVPVVPQVTPRGGAKKGAEPVTDTTALTLGPFSLQPATAALAVGAKQTITVNFTAQGAKLSLQQVGIDVSDRDYADHPEGIMYEVAGESVIPGIDCQNVESIFEEHTLCSQLDPLAAQHNVYAITERKFDFGAVLAAVGGGAPHPGVKANLKFTNVFKVQATVNFSIKPGGPQTPNPFPMTAQPAQLVIPANESRFMTVHFVPNAIRSYFATFEAVVESGGDAATSRFSCELRGEGTLPSLTLELPQLDKGPQALRFPRLLVGKKASLSMSVTNNGILPATARISMDPHSCFQLAPGPLLITLASKQSHRIAVDFTATVVKQHAHEVVIDVQQNPFEKHRVAVVGECYMEALTLEGLPQDSTDELRLPDLSLNQTGRTAFVLHNMSDKPYRFEWAALAPLTFSPSVGHLPAGAVKDIVVTYLSDKPLQLKAAVAALKAAQLKMLPGAAASDWDNRVPAGSPGGTAAPEPKLELANAKEAPPVSLPLKVSVVIDDACVECDTGPINFKPTVMFQTRTFNFNLKNAGLSNVDYKWAVQTLDGANDTSGTYVVTPEGGCLAAGETAAITVKFSPQEVEDCSRRLVATIPNLSASLQAPNRALTASVLRPWCHFDLPPSDYITAGRRSPDMPSPGRSQGPIDPATKVLEIQSLGVKVHNVKRFWVLNPTSMAYTFAWEGLDAGNPGAAASPFHCSTMTGVLAPGKRYEMVFQYTPNEDKLQESFWRFKIPEHKLDMPVLVVGHVSEPRVAFDRPSLSFGKVLVGGRTHATINLLNSEYMPFQFDLDKASYDASPARLESTGRAPALTFEPSSGTIPAGDGRLVELSPDAPNHLDFGQVVVHDHVTKAVTLVNAGSLMYEYNWKLGGNPRLAVSPSSGSVVNGRTYTLLLSGVGHKPALDFSFQQHDFGPSFVKQSGMQAAQKTLRIKNNDNSDLSFDMEYESSDSMTVDCPPSVLAPGASQEVSIIFSPCEARSYREEIPFKVNGLYTMKVVVMGEGSNLKLELGNAAHRNLNLGAVSCGGQTSKTVQICNRSKVTCQASFAEAAQQLARCAVAMSPAGTVTIPARASLDITFFYRPAQRTRAWHQEVAAQVAGVTLPLLTLSAACLGTQLTLSTDNLPFGTVVLGSEAKQRLQVENSGDVGTKYTLDVAALAPHFAAFPASGFLAPNQQAQVDITFHPRAIHPDIRVDKVRCKVEGGEDSFLTLTGACSQTQAQAVTLDFKAAVRGSSSQTLTLANPSVTPWQLKPVIQNDYWSGPEVLMVPTGAEAAYAITYRPLSMSTQEKQHEGSVFFPIPDGTGLLYKLSGVAQSPMPAGTIQCQVAAKQAHVQSVKVANWLNKPQRFKVVIDLQQSDPATQLTAPPHVDVAGLSQKDCKLHFHTLTEGQTTGSITFQNQTTGEYIFYNLAFTAGPAGLQGMLRLEGPVRSRYQLKLKGTAAGPEGSLSITVPLGSSEAQVFRFHHWLTEKTDYKASFRGKSSGAFECKPTTVAAAPAGPNGLEQQVEVTFEPSSIHDNYHETLLVSSATGGEYACQVNGRCLPPKPSGPFEVVKGTVQITWKNVFSKQVEFFYSVDNPAFSVKASESLAAKKTTNVAVTYKEDPSKPRTAKLMISCPGEAPSPWVFYLQA
ncbi:hypothetical protein WJX79_000331 [Trebouxia sp. C0005]